jgi:hypothetical protein
MWNVASGFDVHQKRQKSRLPLARAKEHLTVVRGSARLGLVAEVRFGDASPETVSLLRLGARRKIGQTLTQFLRPRAQREGMVAAIHFPAGSRK